MHGNVRRTLVLAAFVVVASAVAAGGVAAAQQDNDHRNGKRALVGTWDVTLTLPGAPPGRVLATFNTGGTTVESAAASPSTRSASHGVWKRIGRDLFSVTRVFFRFNPQTGAYLGTTKVNATARVAPDGQTFAAVSLTELRDPAGNLVAGDLRGTATGVRMSVEQIPDRP
jgi:hypothetical protein